MVSFISSSKESFVMKKVLITILIILSAAICYAEEWTFEVNPNNIQMLSSSKLERPAYFLETFSVKNMINLSFFTARTFIPPYKDVRVFSFESPKKWPFLVIENGDANIYDGRSWGQTANMSLGKTSKQYIAAGYPLLIQEGKKTKLRKTFFSRRRCPRTAIGIHPNGSLIIYVTTRATLKEVQSYLHTMGCTDAINFDGGSSTFLYIDGKKLFSSNKAKSYPNVLCWE